ncbi:hypothetical protein CTA2_11831 [Colletotrichum tanaceti]|uniref:C2H2-type domain-containing protein n=1 Tax=Colletotrichum tanaceti TaxID=1306861 RepID=A0A4U6X0X3_9PEZI|nr:hypothetical protein CTA2_11831 [Colletotrichum tanaceti]TKW48644.1 hypothetical protein CTA1_1228 [Colletotrichum tanaceti]
MSFNINSLLNPEGSINQEAEVRKILSKAYADCEKTLPKQSPKEGALAYFSNVLIHITEALYKNFTDELLDEERLNSTGHTIVNQAYRANGFNDMGILEFHTRKRKMLRSMKEAVDSNAAALKNIRECASPVQEKRPLEPNQVAFFSESSSRSSFSYSASSSGAVFSTVGSQASLSDGSHTYRQSDRYRRSSTPAFPQDDDDGGNEDVGDDDEDDDDDTTMGDGSVDGARTGTKIDMDFLRHRGKGHYICPHWQTCQKGGQDHKGGPKIFYRNCMYRQHLQKHSKPHKCMLPGCPNKDGFARKDQLVRHQANVKHDQPLPLPGPRRQLGV